MAESISKSRNNSIDIFRYFCAVLVVAIHTHPFSEIDANIGFIFSQIVTRIGVPFFFCVAGYFYIQKLEKEQKVFFSYIKKLFLTYFLWSLVYFISEFISRGRNEIKSFAFASFINFFFKGSYYHFWFFPALIISTCIVTLFYKLHLKKLLVPSAIVLYAIGCIGCSYYSLGIKIPYLSTLFTFSEFTAIRRIFMMGLPFFICGYAVLKLKKKSFAKSNIKIFCGISAFFLAWLVEIFLVIKMQLQSNIIITFFLYPLLIFVMLFLLKNPLPKLNKISSKCRTLANFTYYSHPLILLIIKSLNNSVPNTMMFVLALSITLIIGLILSKFSKNKFIKILIG